MDVDSQAALAPAVLLLGGRGTRISALYPECPKALVPVCGCPILEHQLEWMAASGLRRVHLAAGHLAHCIFAWLNKRDPGGDGLWTISAAGRKLRVSCSAEPSPLGTGGGLRYACGKLEEYNFVWVFNGDSIVPELDFADLSNALLHSADMEAVLAVVEMRDPGRYGAVDFDSNGQVLAFREKALRKRGWVNGGVYLMRASLMAAIPADTPVSLETTVFPALAARGVLCAVPTKGPLLDMGTPDGLSAMECFFQ